MSATAVKNTHPKALPFLFLTEMWERFGFYVAQGLLVLYMTQYYGFSDSESFTISGIFSGLVYISPFLGGLLADRILGFKTTIIWGGFFLIIGYALLSLSSIHWLFYPALATIIVGNGLLKPNISSLLGSQYAADNPRRDSGFTLFYIGINIGVALSGVSGYVKNALGWQTTFALASMGMIIGLTVFLFGLRYIKNTQKLKPVSSHLRSQVLVGCLLAILVVTCMLKISILANILLPAAGIALLIFLVVLTLKEDAESRKRMIMLNTLIISSIVFWTLFLQLFTSANLYIDRLVDKNLFGMHLTTTIFYASESVFIMLLGPVFAILWEILGTHNKNPSAISKFVLGILFAGLGFLVLAISTHFPNSQDLINPLWVFLAYFLLTIGELLLSPIGLSAVTSLAPANLVGMMMGVWFVATGFGGLFAGMLAKIASIPQTAQTAAQKLAIYQHAFFTYACLAFAVTIVLFLVELG